MHRISLKTTSAKGKVGGGGEEVEPKYFVRGEPSLTSLKRLRVEVDLPGVRSGKEVRCFHLLPSL